MLQQHREALEDEPRRRGRNRHDDDPYIVGAYNVDQIKEFNRQHDRTYGWTPQFGSFYFNVRRLPETHFGPAQTLWVDSPRA